MKCKHCGVDIIVGSRFCINCCSPIEYDNQTTNQLEENTAKRKKNNKNISKYLKIFLSLFILCLICVVGVTLFYNKSFSDFNTNSVNKLSEFFTIPEIEQDNESNNDKIKITPERIPLNIGESISSKTYVISFDGLDVVDSNNERAHFYSIKKGKEYVLIKLTLENRTQTDTIVSSLFNFVAFVDNKEVPESFSGVLAEGFYSINGLNTKNIVKTGYLCYYVDEGWKEINVAVNIDGLENEPYLFVKNSK